MADVQQQPVSPRLKALQNLSNALPVANQQVAQQQKAGRDLQLQAAVANTPAAAVGPGTGAQLGTAMQNQSGDQQVTAAKGAVDQQQQVAQLGQQAQATADKGQIAGLQAGARQSEMDNVQRFAALNAGVKKELYDDTMQFQKDEIGRTLMNERQLADYARLNAKSDEEYKNYAQIADQASQRKLQTMEKAFDLVQQDLDNQLAIAEQKKDQAAKQAIIKAKRDAEAAMQKEKNKRANDSAAWTTGGTIVGTAVGAYFGGPAGAAAGGAIGGAAGGAVANQTS